MASFLQATKSRRTSAGAGASNQFIRPNARGVDPRLWAIPVIKDAAARKAAADARGERFDPLACLVNLTDDELIIVAKSLGSPLVCPQGEKDGGGYQAGSGLIPPLPPEEEHHRRMMLDHVVKKMLDPSCSPEETAKDMFELMKAYGALESRPLKIGEGCSVMAPAESGDRRGVDVTAALISGLSLKDGDRHTGKVIAVPQTPGLDDLGSLGEGTAGGRNLNPVEVK